MKSLVTWVFAFILTVFGAAAMAALPESVDTAVTAAQTDVLAMIGKGFAYGGAVAGIWVAYKYFRRVIKGG
jgi:hypothetical protein